MARTHSCSGARRTSWTAGCTAPSTPRPLAATTSRRSAILLLKKFLLGGYGIGTHDGHGGHASKSSEVFLLRADEDPAFARAVWAHIAGMLFDKGCLLVVFDRVLGGTADVPRMVTVAE